MKNNTKERGQKSSKNKLKNLIIFAIIGVIFYVAVNSIFSKINVNISDSHPGTIFWKSDEKPKIGDYVYFNFEHKLLPKNIKTLSKKLICVAGNNLIINDKFIICDDKKYLIKRKNKTGGGKEIEQFYYNGIVPTGKAIVWGENLESFDSRYWGFVKHEQLHKINIIF
jgi:conjugal transfer pilin signal peptidase TrbI